MGRDPDPRRRGHRQGRRQRLIADHDHRDQRDGAEPRRDFLAGAFGRSYQHWSQAADLSGLFTWDDLNDLNGLVARHRLDAPRLRLFNDGEQVPPYEYLHTSVTKRSEVRHRVEPSGLHRQISAGASLVLDAVDKLHPGVQTLAEALERHFRTDVQANLYASWHPTEAFGIHWDDHDTVVFQLEGAKRWNLYGATRTDPLRLDVEAPAKPEGPPLAEVVLQTGDMPYLPRGWWHAVAATQGRSLHLTCGLTPATDHHLLVWLAGQLLHSPTLRAAVPTVASPAKRAAYAEQLRKEGSEALHDHASRSSPRPWTPAIPAAPPRPCHTSATSPPTWSWPLRPPGPRWRDPTRLSSCAPPDTNGSSTRPCAPRWRPWCPAPA
ncbi:JmjC domain-containing protein [Streptomyces sp. NPDC090085]|uniref:JmjC domain-containing protein n=1 Tax=Streptomyces sp. NPDC090085 TaxID=3365943 RepID=UPI00382A439F